MRTAEAKKAFSWGTDNSVLTVGHTAVLGGVGAGSFFVPGVKRSKRSFSVWNQAG